MRHDTKQAPARVQEIAIERPRAHAEFKELGGSASDHFNQILIRQVFNSLWLTGADDQDKNRHYQAAAAAPLAAQPQSELEGMLLAQMIACHHAAMECYRRAMLTEQSFEGRQVNLGAANKLSRTYTMLLEGLNRHRGKGQQVVRVEHVTVQAGGQAIVGVVTQRGGGHGGSEDRAHAQAALAHAPEPEMRGADPAREPVPVTGGEGAAALPDARRRQRQRRADR